MLDVREWGGVEQMQYQMKMIERGSEACALFRVYFLFWVWGFSQTNRAKAQTLTNGVWLLEISDINSGLSPFKDPSPISVVASPFG